MSHVSIASGHNADKLRARVFISCGQSNHNDEAKIAHAIESRLRQLGYEPYIAISEQSLRGLVENIFEQQLANSEYFIFVDFKREQLLKDEKPADHRGSLFSHQELAVASYLHIDALIFREEGVKKDDGIMKFVQGNGDWFTDRQKLPDLIAKKVRQQQQQQKWGPHWRNELVLERTIVTADEPNTQSQMRRFFDIRVRNLHRRKVALNCCVYLEQAFKLKPRRKIQSGSLELKWAGYNLPNAHILPGRARRFNALHIFLNSPLHARFENVFSDWREIIPSVEDKGRYELTYLVVADNFPPVRGLFTLDLKPSINQTTLSLDRQDRAFELRKKKFFDLARRFRAATDSKDVERLRDEMGRMISGV